MPRRPRARIPTASVLLALLTALVLGALGVVAAPGAHAARVDVPGDAWVTITGHGYGHGHGMSQYGAEGAARRGLGAGQIVRFYYPGTTMGRAGGYVSVLITADTDDNTVVLPRPGLTLRNVVTGVSWRLPDNGADRWMLRAGQDGRSQIWFRRGTWQLAKVLANDAMFHAGGLPVSLVLPGGGVVAYRSQLWSRRTAEGSRDRLTLNIVRLDSYLRGVVPREIPASWSPAAVQAQAIAARTYAAYERAHPLSDAYQICDTTSCQVYGGYSAEHPASNEAIRATSGLVLLYGGRPAFTQFSASSGGWTSAGSMPYLKAQPDPYDDWPGNAVHTWRVRVDDGVIERAFPRIGNLRAIRVTARDGNGDWGGRIRTMELVGGRATVTVSGPGFRSRLGLRSEWVWFRAVRR